MHALRVGPQISEVTLLREKEVGEGSLSWLPTRREFKMTDWGPNGNGLRMRPKGCVGSPVLVLLRS